MSKKGGYQIINLQNKEFKKSPSADYPPSFEFPGIYDYIEGTNKTILVSGIVFGGKLQNDDFCSVVIDGSTFRLVLRNGRVVVVSDTDVVHIEQ